MTTNDETSPEPTESLPPGALRLLNPQQKRIFNDPAPKLPESVATLCVCCPAAIWRAQSAGGWTGLCTIFHEEVTQQNAIWSCEGYNMAVLAQAKKENEP